MLAPVSPEHRPAGCTSNCFWSPGKQALCAGYHTRPADGLQPPLAGLVLLLLHKAANCWLCGQLLARPASPLTVRPQESDPLELERAEGTRLKTEAVFSPRVTAPISKHLRELLVTLLPEPQPEQNVPKTALSAADTDTRRPFVNAAKQELTSRGSVGGQGVQILPKPS